MKVSTISKNAVLFLTLFNLFSAYAEVRVNSSFLGTYKLIENNQGDCPEELQVKEKESNGYALWLTFRNESGSFVGNEKYSDINAPTDSKTDTCMTAGPVVPFCYETRKELTRFNKEKLVLEKFYGRKTNYSSKARYRYSKVERIEDGLKVTQLEMEKALALGVFTITPIEVGATNITGNPFIKIKKHNICTYGKN